LRENHSGMETKDNIVRSVLLEFRCVRTIVVWKLAGLIIWSNMYTVLRENHSGMETQCHRHPLSRSPSLRENHSGMETSYKTRGDLVLFKLRENHSGMETTIKYFAMFTSCKSCVRTIVVWKLK